EHVAPPAVRDRHRGEENSQPRARPEADHCDQTAAGQDDGGRAPGRGSTDAGGEADAVRLAVIPALRRALVHPGATPRQAGTAAARTTGFSTIGRLITADSTPNRTGSHHTASYEPRRTNTMPPRHPPRKPPR